ncbi:hypothetical protein [Xenorhabdus kozodoii]|uniref:Uncharacterized protein n=1 Tax=Xenorhabdus kozodoii TaxID=351676 RepID=A0A2D0LGC7_9GAMM|nr:hypothetical protein [Xenorhabdus kozodoii]PHM74685.1 hypothetical protein Xkoz_00611 [Xenorhabdus kozodoii]
MNLLIADMLEYKCKIKQFALGNKNLLLFLCFLFIPAKASGIFYGLIHLSQYVTTQNNTIDSFYLSLIFLLVYIIFYSVQRPLFPLEYSNGFISSLVDKKTFFVCRIMFMIYSAIPISIFFFVGFLSNDSNSTLSQTTSVLFLLTSFAVIGFSLSELKLSHSITLSFLFILLSILRCNSLCNLVYTFIIFIIPFWLFTQNKKSHQENKVHLSNKFSSPYLVNLFYFLSINKIFILNIIASIVFLFFIAYIAYQQVPDNINYIVIGYLGGILYILMILFYNLIHINEKYLCHLINFISNKKLLLLNYCVCLAVFTILFVLFSLFITHSFYVVLFLYYCLISVFTALINLSKTQYTKLLTLCSIVLFSCLGGYIYA